MNMQEPSWHACTGTLNTDDHAAALQPALGEPAVDVRRFQ
jgi:hypothetical protein